jgi:hypothetical protein
MQPSFALHLFLSVLYWFCPVKRSRALRGRNPTRNSRTRAGEWPARPWRLKIAGAVLSSCTIHLPYHASENPTSPNTLELLFVEPHAACLASLRCGGPPGT